MSMALLRIQHSTPSYEAWKRVFDSDPADRKGSGVRRYSVYRSVSDPSFVVIDLEFDGVAEADAFLEKLRRVWASTAGPVMRNPEARVVVPVESRSL